MTKPLFKKICIVGVGLIGGSLGKSIKKNALAKLVIGIVRKDSNAKEAMRVRALDVATKNLREGVADADLVIFAGPVSVIQSQMELAAPYLKKGAIVIDVGSSKGDIQQTAKRALRRNIFVGCHPMAGSEKTGIAAADGELFKGSICFMTVSNARVAALWKALGSKPVVLSAGAHDALVAKVSHTPHALAFSLFQMPKNFPKGVPVNPSLRELLRLAKSDPQLWADVFASNRTELLKSIADFERKGLQRLKAFLKAGNKKTLAKFISVANKNAHHGS